MSEESRRRVQAIRQLLEEITAHREAGCPWCGGPFKITVFPESDTQRTNTEFQCWEPTCQKEFNYCQASTWWAFTDDLILECRRFGFQVLDLTGSCPPFDLKRIALDRNAYLKGEKTAREIISLIHCENLIKSYAAHPRHTEALSRALEKVLLLTANRLFELRRQKNKDLWKVEQEIRVHRFQQTVDHWRSGGIHSPHADATYTEINDARFFADWSEGKKESYIEKKLKDFQRLSIQTLTKPNSTVLYPIPTFREFIERRGLFQGEIQKEDLKKA